MELVAEWVRLVSLGDLSTLRLLYAPEAVLHEGRKRVVGRDAIIEHMRARHSGFSPQATVLGGRDDVVAVELSVDGRTSLSSNSSWLMAGWWNRGSCVGGPRTQNVH
jgi:hypothetical protein